MAFPAEFHTSRLRLRPIAAGDADAVFDAYATDPEVTRFLTWRPHASREETAAYIAHCLARDPEAIRTYAILGRADGAVRGGFHLTRPAPGTLHFGCVLARRWWGRGLMTEALAEVVRWARAEPAINRIESFCDADNAASARVMEKAGLVRERLAPRLLVHPNLGPEPRDCLVYARTR